MRAEMADLRARAHAADPEAGVALAARLPRQIRPPQGAIVGGYWPIRSEIDPRPLMRRLEAYDARIALPITPPRGTPEGLTFRLWDGEPLSPSGFGVQEPSADGAPVDPDWLLVPLLAFDRFGGRLGYGAGHFDRTLERLRAEKSVFALGLAFAMQEVAAAPSDLHDERLDAILTERSYMPAERED